MKKEAIRTVNELLLGKERYSIETRTSKISNIMLQVPIVPHSDSGEEDDILQLVCPAETDVLFGSVGDECHRVPEEIRCLFGVDDDSDSDRSLDADDRRSGAESVLLHDTFFADIKAMEERNEMMSTMSRRPKRVGNRVSTPFCKVRNRDHLRGSTERNPLSTSIKMEPIVEQHQQQQQQQQLTDQFKFQQIYNKSFRETRDRQSPRSFDEAARDAMDIGRQVPVSAPVSTPVQTFTLQRAFSDASDNRSINSASTTTSAVSYSSASVMKLKARKRMLERHYSRRSLGFDDSISLLELSASSESHYTALTVG
jgi:hypothetical protein